jgi:four helix bundle protein
VEEGKAYRNLRVWQMGMDLAEASYLLTRQFPREELFGLTGQIRRAAAAIPANIAEGYGREGRREYLQFLRIAQGSLKELETHLLLATRVELCTDEGSAPLLDTADQLGRMLHTLIRKLENKTPDV